MHRGNESTKAPWQWGHMKGIAPEEAPPGDPASNTESKVSIAAVNGAKKGSEVSPRTNLQRCPVCVSLSDGLLKAIGALWSESTLQWKRIWSWLRQGEIGLKTFFSKQSGLNLP